MGFKSNFTTCNMIIAFEGGDQAGKCTQSSLLHDSIPGSVLFDFPDYSSGTGMKLRRFLDRGHANNAEFHALMAANVSESYDAVERAVSSGRTCVMNRYVHSNLIYGMARGFDRGWLESLSDMPRPDTVVLLDLDRDVSRARKPFHDTMEADRELQDRARGLYLQEAAANKWIVVHAERGVHEIRREIRHALESGKHGNVPFM